MADTSTSEVTTGGEGPRRVVVETARLQRVGARPGLVPYLSRLWAVRHFIAYEARMSVLTQNREHLLGNVWLVLTPVLNGLTYLLIFGVLLGTSRGVENFIGYLIVGVFMFAFTSRGVTQVANTLRRKNTVVEAFNFPRIALPVSALVKEAYSYAITLVAMLVMVLLIPPLESVTWRWVLLLPVVVLQTMVVLGLGMLCARLVSKVRDFSQVLSFLIRVWMYGSGVFYSIDQFVTHPTVYAVMQWNPMHQVLDISRKVLLYGQDPALWQWGILALWAIGSLAVGTVLFWRADESLGRSASR